MLVLTRRAALSAAAFAFLTAPVAANALADADPAAVSDGPAPLTDGKAEGTLTVNGKTTKVAFAYARSVPGFFDKNVKEASDELAKAKQLAPDRAETYYNEAILTQEYKAKSGKGGDAELLNAKKLFGDFIAKASGAGEFGDAVKRSKERMAEIDQIIEFNKQSEKDRKASEADLKQKAAETEAKGEEPAPATEGEKKDEKKPE